MLPASAASIIDFGARPDKNCTSAIQQAIDRAGEAQGVVFVPPGRYISGMLNLRDGVTLWLHPDAVVQASGDIQDFPASERHVGFQNQRHHFILAEGCRNVTITGGGTLDGNGPAFWEKQTAPDSWIKARQPRVSPMIELRNCRHLTLEHIKVINSPGWTVHPYCCDHVVLNDVTVDNHLYGPNTDGFDINGCRDVLISNCNLSCGDDGIIIKATTGARSSERIAVTNCIVRSNCIGIGLGQETASGIRQVTVSNCVVYESNRIFSIGIWEGGTVEDVIVNGLVGDTMCKPYLSRVIHLEVKQHAARDEVPLGRMHNIMISNVLARGAGRCMLGAQQGTWLDDVVMRDIRMDFNALENADELSPPDGISGSSQYFNRNLTARRKNAAVVLENLRRFSLDGLFVTWPDGHDLPYHVVWASNLHDAVINAPFARGHAGAEPFCLENSSGVLC